MASRSTSSFASTVGVRTIFWSIRNSPLCVVGSVGTGVVGLVAMGVVFPWDAISRDAKFVGMHERLLVQWMRNIYCQRYRHIIKAIDRMIYALDKQT